MRILVVDDHELVRRGICSVLTAEPSITLCGEAVDGYDAIEKAKALRPDIIVMDVSMPRLNGLDATREVKRIFPNIEIVIVSQHEAPEMMRQAFNAGACGYVVKSSISADLLSAVAKAKDREIFVKPAIKDDENRNPDLQEILQRSAAYEQALRESEERFRSAMNNLAEGLYTLDNEGHVNYINPSAEKMLGWAPKELLGKNMHESVHYKYRDGAPYPEDNCPILRVLHDALEIHEFEDFYMRKDGTFFPIVLSASPMKIKGEMRGIVVSFRDDTKRRETEEALQQSERIYHAIGESIDYGVWICNAQGRNIYASSSFLKLIGLTQKEYSDSGWANVLHSEDAQATIDTWNACVREGTFWQREHRFKRPGGGWLYILSRGAPIRDPYGKIQYWAGINLDIQQWKEAEVVLEARVAKRTEELLKARNELRGLSVRLLKAQDEERRRIARELHDGVGQLLAAMTMSVPKLLANNSNLDEESIKIVKEVESLIEEALRDIRTMSYLLHPPLLDEIGLAPALQWYVGGFSERSSIGVQLEMDPELGKLPRDIDLSLFRIVQECLTNIHRHSGSPTANISLSRFGNDVILKIRDEGNGIPPEVNQKITSGDSVGVGIRGMRERLRQFGGRLDVQSDSKGTIVTAVLPARQEKVSEDDSESTNKRTEVVQDRQTQTDPTEKAATILCIDDEATGMFARKLLLESAGHHVIEARSGPEGIRLFKTQKVDAVILDYWMSGMKGTAVASTIKEINPSVPIVVLSGLPDFPGETTGVIDEWLLKGNNRPEQLLVTIKSLLERRSV